MRVLGILGSPREDGNTSTILKQILKGAEEIGFNKDLIILNRLKINPCQACYQCVEKGRCVQNDDMQMIYSKMVKAEVIVLATPVYMGYMTAQMKIFVDRCFALMEIKEEKDNVLVKSRLPKDKKGIIVVTCGGQREDSLNLTLYGLKDLLNYLGISIIKEIKRSSLSKKKDVEKYSKLLDEAYEIGRNLKS